MIPLFACWQTFLQVTLVVNALWYGFSFAAYQFFPFGLLPGLLVVLAAHLLRVPPPAQHQVEKVIGKDLHLIDNYSENNNALMRTVAHRGAALDAPENSLIAFKQCAKDKCMYIEFDVTLTKDEVPVVFHDKTLERVANDKRAIGSLDHSELKTIDISANHPFNEKYSGTIVPTLDATIKQLLADDQKMFIDIKECDYRMVTVITSLFETFPTLYDNAVVTTFFPNIIYAIRKKNPKIIASLAYRPYFFSHTSYAFQTGVGPRRYSSWWMHYLSCLLDVTHSWALPKITYYFIGLSVIFLHKDSASPQSVQQWRDKGIRPCIWTVNKPIDKQYITRTLKCTYLTDTLVGESSLNFIESNKFD